MKKYCISIFRTIIILTSVIFACISQSCKDDFTTNSDYKLTMCDSILFDTILTQTISPTAIFKIYNKEQVNIKISSITLQSEKNYFKVNVNGKSGTSFSDVEILAGDSIFVFVKIIAAESGEKLPIIIEDKLNFIYNGNCQTIVLQAFGQDAYHKKEPVHITENTSWANDKPYLIYDSLIVDSTATLTIAEGTTLYMKKNATVLVKGSLVMNGTEGKEIVMRTDRTDYFASDVLYDQIYNQWGGIEFTSSSSNNIINHAFIRSGAFGIKIDSSEIVDNEYRLTIANSQIHNVLASCLYGYNASVYAYNSIFTNGTENCVFLWGGQYRFDHCTMDSNNKGIGNYTCAVTMSNKTKTAPLPFKANFNNCIVSGDTSAYRYNPDLWNELYIETFDKNDSLDYKFDHCLLFTKLTDEEIANDENHFNVIIRNKTPRFQLIDKDKLLFDYHLSEDSPCKERGDLALVLINENIKADKDGVIRNIEAAPDLGALQIVVKSATDEGNDEKETKE